MCLFLDLFLSVILSSAELRSSIYGTKFDSVYFVIVAQGVSAE